MRSVVLLLLAATLHAEEPYAFDRTLGALPKDIVPFHYTLRIEPDLAASTFKGTETVGFTARTRTQKIVLHAVDLDITTAALRTPEGESFPLQPVMDAAKQWCTFALPKEIEGGGYHLELAWTGRLSEKPRGLYTMRYSGADGREQRLLATQMQASDARRMFPCWDEPVFRASVGLTAVASPGLTALANMPAEREQALPDGRREITFADTPPMSTYLVAFCMGEFESLESRAGGVALRVFTTPGKREQARYALESTERLLEYYAKYFGTRYPLPKLDQIALPNPPAAGMENWGLIIYDDTAFLYDPATSSQRAKERAFEVIAHELAHQWFGNLVTNAWWDNLWLNEGFASWMGTRATDHFNPGWQVWLRALGDKEYAMVRDARATTHPIQQRISTEAEADDAFDEITYSKGQSLLRMLELYLDPAAFQAGIQRYMQRHAYSLTTTADLWNALESASAKPVRALAAGWTEQPGFPVVLGRHGMWQQERFTINQTNAAPLQWQIPFSAAEVTRLSAPPQVTMLTPGKDAGSPAPASPGQKGNVGGAGYYRVQYDDETFATLAKAAPAFPDADRLNFLNDSWAMVQANRSRPAAHLDLLSTVASTEQSTAVWDALLGMIGYMDHLQQGAPGRPAFRSWAIRLLRPQLERLGWEPKPGESELIPPLRTDVIARLARYGDEDVRTEAASRFARYLADPASLKGDLRGTIIGLAGRFADLATFEELLARAQRETSTELRRELLGAVGAAQDPALAQRALQLSLGDTLRPREATRMVSRIGDSAEHPALAWDFAQKNLPALLAKLSAMEADDYVPGLLRPFQTEQRAAELEQFAKTNLPPSATAAVARATDDIRFKAEFRARLLPALDAWLARQP